MIKVPRTMMGLQRKFCISFTGFRCHNSNVCLQLYTGMLVSFCISSTLLDWLHSFLHALSLGPLNSARLPLLLLFHRVPLWAHISTETVLASCGGLSQVYIEHIQFLSTLSGISRSYCGATMQQALVAHGTRM